MRDMELVHLANLLNEQLARNVVGVHGVAIRLMRKLEDRERWHSRATVSTDVEWDDLHGDARPAR